MMLNQKTNKKSFFKFIPTRKQFNGWSIPNKVTYIGFVIVLITLIIPITKYTYDSIFNKITRRTIYYVYLENINNNLNLIAISFGPFPVEKEIPKTFYELLGSVASKHLFKNKEIYEISEFEFYDFDLNPIKSNLTFGKLPYPGIVFIKAKDNNTDIDIAKLLMHRNEALMRFSETDKR